MIPLWTTLDGNDRATFSATVAFLRGRLTESGTIAWALRLEPDQQIERIAVAHLLDSPDGPVLKEPWAQAWHLIKESWSQSPDEEDPLTDIHTIGQRLHGGDRSSSIVSAIVGLVKPSVEIKRIGSHQQQAVRQQRRPRKLDDLLWARLTSRDLVDLNELGLAELTEIPFLMTLANALEASVHYGLDVADRIRSDGEPEYLRTGLVHRVRYTQRTRTASGENETDAFHRGIAPAVKLLHAVVMRIAELDHASALPFVQLWRLCHSPIHIRLWAATALETNLVSHEEVGEFLIEVDARQFWDLYSFPEIAELRAACFTELERKTQNRIVSRLRRLPPHSWWRKTGLSESDRQFWALRELKRIELAGAKLTPHGRSWLEAGVIQFPNLDEMNIDDGFQKAPKVYWIPPSPDDQYDRLQGIARLTALEAALSSGGRGVRSFMRAQDWLHQPNKATSILQDLESVEDGGNGFPSVWNHFGWVHRPEDLQAQRDLQNEAERVLQLLNGLSRETLSAAIEGISNWLDDWREQVLASPLGLSVWLKVWPTAVEATNTNEQRQSDSDLSVSDPFDDPEPMYIDKSYTSAGKLISVLLSACLSLDEGSDAPAVRSVVRRMQDAVIGEPGRSGLVARYRLIERLPLFLRTDFDWTIEHLIPTLSKDDESLVLWRAVARRTRTTDVLKLIGNEMAERAADLRLDRQTRKSLAASLVKESLHAFRDNRTPAVPTSHIQQMLRSLDDEVRGDVARGIREFVEGVEDANNEASAEERFRSAVAPFLQKVWPQERSLSTPSVHHFFAQLPATSGDAFTEAVDVIERFLGPFQCWSILHYFLDIRGQLPNAPKLSNIDDAGKANALLRLLDLTVGTSEGAVIPYDLSDALEQVRTVAPGLVNSPAYRRLSTAARR